MAKLHKKIVSVLRKKFVDLQDGLDDLPGGRVSGVVVSAAFETMSHQQRQSRLQSILENELTPQERSAVGAIALLTPAEASAKA